MLEKKRENRQTLINFLDDDERYVFVLPWWSRVNIYTSKDLFLFRKLLFFIFYFFFVSCIVSLNPLLFFSELSRGWRNHSRNKIRTRDSAHTISLSDIIFPRRAPHTAFEYTWKTYKNSGRGLIDSIIFSKRFPCSQRDREDVVLFFFGFQENTFTVLLFSLRGEWVDALQVC